MSFHVSLRTLVISSIPRITDDGCGLLLQVNCLLVNVLVMFVMMVVVVVVVTNGNNRDHHNINSAEPALSLFVDRGQL